MKIFYAVQATGNGHIARAIELLPHLQQYGSVDVFLSGSNSSLPVHLPVRFTSSGVSLFYTRNGGLDYLKMIKSFSATRVWKEAYDLPVERYDCVLIDYESIASLSCRLKKVPCIGFGHQASFMSAQSPRPPVKNIAGEWILKYYSPASEYIGLHFKGYDDFIFNPVIKQQLLSAGTQNKNYVTVYLPQYDDEILIKHFSLIPDMEFHIFSKKPGNTSTAKNILVRPVNNTAFNESILNCCGVITSAGFETPAEILYLRKKLLCIPIKAQYEQQCNAAALRQFDVPVIKDINKNFRQTVIDWLQQPCSRPLEIQKTTAEIVADVIKKAEFIKMKSAS